MDRNIGNNLKKMRNVSSFTQDEVASYFGIKRSTYANYENGEREIPLAVLEKAANLFGCELYTFFEEDVSDDMALATAFRIDGVNVDDLKEIARFKDIVKSYIKMDQLDMSL